MRLILIILDGWRTYFFGKGATKPARALVSTSKKKFHDIHLKISAGPISINPVDITTKSKSSEKHDVHQIDPDVVTQGTHYMYL